MASALVNRKSLLFFFCYSAAFIFWRRAVLQFNRPHTKDFLKRSESCSPPCHGSPFRANVDDYGEARAVCLIRFQRIMHSSASKYPMASVYISRHPAGAIGRIDPQLFPLFFCRFLRRVYCYFFRLVSSFFIFFSSSIFTPLYPPIKCNAWRGSCCHSGMPAFLFFFLSFSSPGFSVRKKSPLSRNNRQLQLLRGWSLSQDRGTLAFTVAKPAGPHYGSSGRTEGYAAAPTHTRIRANKTAEDESDSAVYISSKTLFVGFWKPNFFLTWRGCILFY